VRDGIGIVRQRDAFRIRSAQSQRRPRQRAVADGSQVRPFHVSPRARRHRRRSRLAAAAHLSRRRGSRRRRERGDGVRRRTVVVAWTVERCIERTARPSRDARGRSPGRGRFGRRRERHARALRRSHRRAGGEEPSRGPRRVRLEDAARVASRDRFPTRIRRHLQSWLSRGDRRPQRLRLPRPRFPLPRVRHLRAHPPAVCGRRGHRADARDRLRRVEGLSAMCQFVIGCHHPVNNDGPPGK
jgi:hypothetical protein